jgi:hypothetical protein
LVEQVDVAALPMVGVDAGGQGAPAGVAVPKHKDTLFYIEFAFIPTVILKMSESALKTTQAPVSRPGLAS